MFELSSHVINYVNKQEMLALIILIAILPFYVCRYYVTTLAGTGKKSYLDGQGIHASFSSPTTISLDAVGNCYVADSQNGRVRIISPTGYVTTLAGGNTYDSADGQDIQASFRACDGLVIDLLGNIIVTDNVSSRIRLINGSGYVSTIAGSGDSSFVDGQGIQASFNGPSGVAIDSSNNIFVADFNNNRIRKINSSGYVSTVAGSGVAGHLDGYGVQAILSAPSSVNFDSLGNLFILDSSLIRKMNTSGYVSTFAGGGTQYSYGNANQIMFSQLILGIVFDSIGNLYVSDSGSNKILKINTTGYVSTIAGKGTRGSADGDGQSAQFNYPQGLAVDANGTLYVADHDNFKIRKIYYSPSISATFSTTESPTVTQIISAVTPISPFISPSISPSSLFSSASETIIISPKTSLRATTTVKIRQMSQILQTYLKPEFTYSALIGMIMVGAVFAFVITRKKAAKPIGRRQKFLQNMEMQRKLELKRQSLARDSNQRKEKSKIRKSYIR